MYVAFLAHTCYIIHASLEIWYTLYKEIAYVIIGNAYVHRVREKRGQ